MEFLLNQIQSPIKQIKDVIITFEQFFEKY